MMVESFHGKKNISFISSIWLLHASFSYQDHTIKVKGTLIIRADNWLIIDGNVFSIPKIIQDATNIGDTSCPYLQKIQLTSSIEEAPSIEECP